MKKIPQTFLIHIDDVKLLGCIHAAIIARIRFHCQLNRLRDNWYFVEITIEELSKEIGAHPFAIEKCIEELLEENYLQSNSVNNCYTINHDLLPYYHYDLTSDFEKYKYHFLENDARTFRHGKYKGALIFDVNTNYLVWLLENCIVLTDYEKMLFKSIIEENTKNLNELTKTDV